VPGAKIPTGNKTSVGKLMRSPTLKLVKDASMIKVASAGADPSVAEIDEGDLPASSPDPPTSPAPPSPSKRPTIKEIDYDLNAVYSIVINNSDYNKKEGGYVPNVKASLKKMRKLLNSSNITKENKLIIAENRTKK
jgi:hypothetical protein